MQIRIPPVRITLHGIKVEECDIPKKNEKQIFILAGGEKTYEAQKPYQAALKAFYAKNRLQQNTTQIQLSDLEKQILHNNLVHQNQNLVQKYMEAMENTMTSNSEIIELQKSNKNKVYRYNVKYVCNLNPNKHELQHCITRKAVATKL